MDVRQILSAVAFTLLLSACGNKSAQTVFPESGSMDSSACSGQALSTRFIVQWEDGHFTTETAASKEDFITNFLEPQLDKIRYVEFDRLIESPEPIKTYATNFQDSWGQDMIGARQVWAQNIRGQGVKVGVVDSYVDVSHPQLISRIAVNTGEIPNNGIDDDRNGLVDDYYGAVFVSNSSGTISDHGTHVAGVIAADPSRGNVEGVAPLAQLIPAQFIGGTGGGTLGDAILAMQYTVSRGAKIINASWGGAPCVASLRNTFLELQSQGILVIVAAGNEGRNIDLYPEYPASFNLANQITVAASSVSDFMTSWSNSGFKYVHVAAPGERIYSTVPGNRYTYMEGTSMAAPFVSGTAALLWSAHPEASATQVRQAIIEAVDVRAGHEFKVNTRGRLNAAKALARLREILR